MIPVTRRAEKLCMDTLLCNEAVRKLYGRDHIYQGFVEPNTLTTLNNYILIKRIDSSVMDKTCTGIGTGRLNRVRLQVDICDTRYSDMARKAALVCEILNDAFPSCVDGETYGTDGRGQKIFNVCSIDVIIWESAQEPQTSGAEDGTR